MIFQAFSSPQHARVFGLGYYNWLGFSGRGLWLTAFSLGERRGIVAHDGWWFPFFARALLYHIHRIILNKIEYHFCNS